MKPRLLVASLLLLLAAAPLYAGPPWIAVEYPANPHDPATRGASLVVRAYHHATPVAATLTATAEGIVNGQRRSLPLELKTTQRTGVYVVRQALPRDGAWVVVINMTGSNGPIASALVSLDPKGRVAAVEVPTRQQQEWTIPRVARADEIETLLQLRVALNAAQATTVSARSTSPPRRR